MAARLAAQQRRQQLSLESIAASPWSEGDPSALEELEAFKQEAFRETAMQPRTVAKRTSIAHLDPRMRKALKTTLNAVRFGKRLQRLRNEHAAARSGSGIGNSATHKAGRDAANRAQKLVTDNTERHRRIEIERYGLGRVSGHRPKT
jgi:hypothetical protein